MKLRSQALRTLEIGREPQTDRAPLRLLVELSAKNSGRIDQVSSVSRLKNARNRSAIFHLLFLLFLKLDDLYLQLSHHIGPAEVGRFG